MADEVDEMLNIAGRRPKSTDMDVDALNLLVTSLRTLKLPSVEKFMDSFKGTGDMIFSSFRFMTIHIL